MGIEIDPHFDPGSERTAALLLFVGFLASFAFIRMSTRLMRSPKVPWWPGSVTPGGLHIHHLVFGIVLLLVSGFLGFALEPDTPWTEIFAAAFGVGAGLTLDEFALWLHLDDVYWSEEGRRSIDAVVLATLFAGLVLLGFAPLKQGQEEAATVFVVALLIQLAACSVAIAKGKVVVGLVGLFVPLVALVGAIRLARPESPWARWRYGTGKKAERATRRFARLDERWTRVRDVIGGAPDAGRG